MYGSSMKTKQEFLQSLPAWDGKERIDTMLTDYLGVADSAYVREVSREIMLSAVAKAMDECRVAALTPILVGPPHCGKSVFLEKLGSGYSSGVYRSVTPETMRGCIGDLLVEVTELNRSVSEMIKRDNPFVVVITTNTMPGVSGNRRFCPVRVGKGDTGRAFVADQDEIDQLWAEALHAYENGEMPKCGISDIRGMKAEQKPIPRKYPYGIE